MYLILRKGRKRVRDLLLTLLIEIGDVQVAASPHQAENCLAMPVQILNL